MIKLPTTPSMRLDGRRALVTGASRGIGMGAAVALAEAGAHVVLAARSSAELEQVVDAIRERGGACEGVEVDVTDIERVTQIIEDTAAFDILVNNAGTNRPGPMQEMTPEDFDAVMNLNVRAAYFVAKAVVKKMQIKGQGGSIINTSSQMGHVGGIDRTIYSASKHAIEGLTRALAIELGKYNIRVNTICPTFIRTPMTEKTFANPELVEWIQSKIKLGRIGEIEDIMGAFVFLASDAAAMMTGSSLMIDGGWTAG
ncbi:MAG: NAD(P)-dependent dehydrogenase (short-subunit alcohol dehydrogenase family) [Gammaproteobacteria bacterium]|jgi:NAD(P)-dependent dehydrogenase (short-subunit alcohol dehydrogenase family)